MTRAGRTHKLNRWEWPVQDIYRRTLRIALDDLSRISAFPARNPCQFGLHVASAGPFGFEFREGRACLPVCAAPADSLIRHSERLGRIASAAAQRVPASVFETHASFALLWSSPVSVDTNRHKQVLCSPIDNA